MPNEIEDDVLYISIEYDVAKHKCPCGCRDVIVTSLSPARWRLIYDGETVSLKPSIGNWTHKCRSHYYITNDRVEWLGQISDEAIGKAIVRDKKDIARINPKKTLFSQILNFFLTLAVKIKRMLTCGL